MSRQPFYEISEAAYLFRAQLQAASARKKQIEEPVRQWCAYELIRAYGISIVEMEFEHRVRVGSKRHQPKMQDQPDWHRKNGDGL